ncbi:MAG: beta-propeller fold lactonase family protein [Nitrososphaeraceae archaeon]
MYHNLGNDQIKQFLFNESTRTLTPNNPDVVYTKDVSGPRHFVFLPNNKFVLYQMNWMGCFIGEDFFTGTFELIITSRQQI